MGSSLNSYFGDPGKQGRHANKARASRQQAIDEMRAIWGKAYKLSANEFHYGEQSIRATAQSQSGNLTAGLAGSGMLGTTVAGNAARGVNMDTNRALGNLATQKAQTDYAKWMDRIQLAGMTQWDQTTFNDPYGGGALAAMQEAGGQAAGMLFGSMF